MCPSYVSVARSPSYTCLTRSTMCTLSPGSAVTACATHNCSSIDHCTLELGAVREKAPDLLATSASPSALSRMMGLMSVGSSCRPCSVATHMHVGHHRVRRRAWCVAEAHHSAAARVEQDAVHHDAVAVALGVGVCKRIGGTIRWSAPRGVHRKVALETAPSAARRGPSHRPSVGGVARVRRAVRACSGI